MAAGATDPAERPVVLLLRLAATPDQVAQARRAAHELAGRAGLAPGRCADVALAVGEICANVVVHAYPDRSDGTFTLRAHGESGTLDVVVADEGVGLRPRDDSPGAGFGLPIVASLTSAMELRPGDAGGSEVRMTFS